jgi:hypothetical protein
MNVCMHTYTFHLDKALCKGIVLIDLADIFYFFNVMLQQVADHYTNLIDCMCMLHVYVCAFVYTCVSGHRLLLQYGVAASCGSLHEPD